MEENQDLHEDHQDPCGDVEDLQDHLHGALEDVVGPIQVEVVPSSHEEVLHVAVLHVGVHADLRDVPEVHVALRDVQVDHDDVVGHHDGQEEVASNQVGGHQAYAFQVVLRDDCLHRIRVEVASEGAFLGAHHQNHHGQVGVEEEGWAEDEPREDQEAVVVVVLLVVVLVEEASQVYQNLEAQGDPQLIQ